MVNGIDCSATFSLPLDLVGLTGNTTNTPDEVAIPIRGGNCRLAVDGPGRVTRIAGRHEVGADVVAVVDFTLPAFAGVAVGLDVRCSSLVCVGMHLRMPNELYVAELTSNLYNASYPTAQGVKYRMVVIAKGDVLKCWINGTSTGAVATAVVSGGFVTFSIYNESGPGGAAVDFQRFYAYQPGGAGSCAESKVQSDIPLSPDTAEG